LEQQYFNFEFLNNSSKNYKVVLRKKDATHFQKNTSTNKWKSMETFALFTIANMLGYYSWWYHNSF
tara:strand:+ start:899 stop:1096 length:198 start_codon:yes stop_codon:yes gene_type:complete